MASFTFGVRDLLAYQSYQLPRHKQAVKNSDTLSTVSAFPESHQAGRLAGVHSGQQSPGHGTLKCCQICRSHSQDSAAGYSVDALVFGPDGETLARGDGPPGA